MCLTYIFLFYLCGTYVITTHIRWNDNSSNDNRIVWHVFGIHKLTSICWNPIGQRGNLLLWLFCYSPAVSYYLIDTVITCHYFGPLPFRNPKVPNQKNHYSTSFKSSPENPQLFFPTCNVDRWQGMHLHRSRTRLGNLAPTNNNGPSLGHPMMDGCGRTGVRGFTDISHGIN